MPKLRRFTACVVVLSFLFANTVAFAEAVDDNFTQISPTETLGIGEYIHGQGYRRLLVRVLMFGSIASQGIHYVPEGTDILFAILYAGGYTDQTKLDGITIRRKHQGELIRVDLEELIEEGQKIPRLQDGDIVSIPFNWRKDVATVGTLSSLIASFTTLALAIVTLRTQQNH
ncbi:MAG: hypothetical protein HYR96_13220 [Deltaproteobacteria bacterium]|nr:hypothetical protein [Deltaproteobacteria bacterium]MBI3295040.1 hypothetical protein [Deltaproteobacteria bacterium]